MWPWPKLVVICTPQIVSVRFEASYFKFPKGVQELCDDKIDKKTDRQKAKAKTVRLHRNITIYVQDTI